MRIFRKSRFYSTFIFNFTTQSLSLQLNLIFTWWPSDFVIRAMNCWSDIFLRSFADGVRSWLAGQPIEDLKAELHRPSSLFPRMQLEKDLFVLTKHPCVSHIPPRCSFYNYFVNLIALLIFVWNVMVDFSNSRSICIIIIFRYVSDSRN